MPNENDSVPDGGVFDAFHEPEVVELLAYPGPQRHRLPNIKWRDDITKLPGKYVDAWGIGDALQVNARID